MAETLTGIGVSGGFAVGPVTAIAPPVAPPADEPAPADLPAAESQVERAFEKVAADLDALATRSDSALKDILAATALIARDPALRDAARSELAAGYGPATAIRRASGSVATAFESMGEYFADRVSDIHGVSDRVIAEVLGVPAPGVPALSEPSIIVARDLTPAETVGLGRAMIAGIVTEEGGRLGHTAILANQYGIPAVVQAAGAGGIEPGTRIAVDGSSGTIILDPSDDLLREQIERRDARAALINAFRGPGSTSDGYRVPLLLNIGNVSDARSVHDVECEGVGLFRTEFLYLSTATEPSIEKQAASYRAVFEAFPRVVIRTLDAGADKPLAFADLGDEENPSLGRRGLRLSMAMPDLLTAQLQAIARAARGVDCHVQVMAPMVATPAEAEWFAERVRAAGLDSAGVMIEIPAAALRARDVLGAVDFGSIGTNDLAQYAMAADRTHGALSELLDPWQPAVLACVKAACDGAADAARPLGVCGEAAGDPLLALVLVGMGVRSLSMAPGLIAEVRASLAMHSLSQCGGIAEAALAAPDAESARRAALALTSDEAAPLMTVRAAS